MSFSSTSTVSFKLTPLSANILTQFPFGNNLKYSKLTLDLKCVRFCHLLLQPTRLLTWKLQFLLGNFIAFWQMNNDIRKPKSINGIQPDSFLHFLAMESILLTLISTVEFTTTYGGEDLFGSGTNPSFMLQDLVQPRITTEVRVGNKT